MNNPALKREASCISPALKQDVLALQHWGCSLGFLQVFSQITQYWVSKSAPSAANSRIPAFFSTDTSLCFLSLSTVFPLSFLLETKILQRYLMFFSKLVLPAAVAGCLKPQENTNTAIKTEGFPSSPQQTSPAHITYFHIFCCPLSHLGQKPNQVEGVVTSCSWLEVILTYSLQCRHIIDWSPGSAVVYKTW